MTKKELVYQKAREILKAHPSCLKYSQLFKKLTEALPDISRNTIAGSLHRIRLDILEGKITDIEIPDKGLYCFREGKPPPPPPPTPPPSVKETDFYKPFAEYLINELEECTRATPLGGSIFGDKWGTPDVIGVYKFSPLDPIQPPIEVISAEIKVDTNQLITAFGQACAYKLFSHKVYLVIPRTAGEDISRIESLCMRFGIGLITFDLNPCEPNFQIRTRASKSEPDYFYLNKYLKKLSEKAIKELFGG
ncbi:hypothetical protein H5T88_07330 [bacterium]|nr:hypothetical protein [bacterium]